MSDDTPHSAAENVDRWLEAMGSWGEENPDVLAWPHKEKQPVVAKTDNGLRLLHDGVLDPRAMDRDGLGQFLSDYGEPSVASLSRFEGRFTKEMFEWEAPNA